MKRNPNEADLFRPQTRSPFLRKARRGVARTLVALLFAGTSPAAAQQAHNFRLEFGSHVGGLFGGASAAPWSLGLDLALGLERGSVILGFRAPLDMSPGGVEDICNLAPSGRCLPQFFFAGGVAGEVGILVRAPGVSRPLVLRGGLGSYWTDSTEFAAMGFHVQGDLTFDVGARTSLLLGPRVLYIPDLESLHVLAVGLRLGIAFRRP